MILITEIKWLGLEPSGTTTLWVLKLGSNIDIINQALRFSFKSEDPRYYRIPVSINNEHKIIIIVNLSQHFMSICFM